LPSFRRSFAPVILVPERDAYLIDNLQLIINY